jgi:hypothetical protein
VLEWFQKRKEDHLIDCEQMQIVAAAATGMLHMPEDLELLTASQKQPPNRNLAQGTLFQEVEVIHGRIRTFPSPIP